MSTCPNTNLPEWKRLTAAVGAVEAMRDYRETGTIRSVSDVLSKINNRTAEQKKAIGFVSEITQRFAQYNNEASQEAAIQLAEKLSENTGVGYQVISLQTAEELLKDTVQKYEGEPSFYHKGQVYLVAEAFDSEHVLHEFSHPIVDAIAVFNSKLFDNLYNQAIALYPNLREEVEAGYDLSEEYIKREVIVRAMATSRNIEQHKSFIDRIIYAIKQLFRKVFGRSIKVDKLSADTSIKDLAKMLQNESFDVHFIESSASDVVQFFKEQEDYKEALAKSTADEVAMKVKNLEGIVKNVASKFVQKNPELANAVKDKRGRDLIEQLIQDIEGIQRTKPETYYKEQGIDPVQIITEIFDSNLRVLFTAIEDSNKILTNLETFSTKVNKNATQEDGAMILSLSTIAETLGLWAAEQQEIALKAGVSSDNQYIKDLSAIQTKAEAIVANIKESMLDLATDLVFESLGKKVMESGKKLWENEMERAQKAGNKRRIDKLNQVKDDYVISREGIRKRLEGKLGDSPAVSSMWEAYVRNPDPIVGGFAKWFEQNMLQAENDTLAKLNAMVKVILPLAEKAGLKYGNEEQFFKDFLFLDKISTGKLRDINDDEASDIEMYEAWSLLNPYKDYKWVFADIADRKRIALQNENWAEYEKIRSEENSLRRFMHNPYPQEFLDAQMVFEEANKAYADKLPGIGTKASTQRDIAIQRLRAIQTQFRQMEYIDEESTAFLEMEEAYRMYNDLYRETNLDGTLKDEESRTIARILKDHRKRTRNLFEFKDIPGVFDLAYDRFLDSIEDLSFEEQEQARKKWILENTEMALKDEFADREAEIYAEIEAIKKRLPGFFNSDIEKLRGLIADIVSSDRDNNNQVDATQLTDEAQKKILDIEKQIVELRGKEMNVKGLTKAESQEIFDMFANDDINWERYKQIMAGKVEITAEVEATMLNLKKLYKELESMKSGTYTSYYVESWQQHLDRIKEEGSANPASRFFTSLDTIVDFNMLMDEGLIKASPAIIKSLLEDEVAINTLLQDSKFRKWFSRNHLAVKKVKKTGERQYDRYTIYRPTSAWSTKTASNDKLKKTVLSTGEVIYRVPKRTKYKSIEFKNKTEKIPGVTVSRVNENEWLPNTDIVEIDGVRNPFRNERYFELLQSRNTNKIKFLEALTEWHLSQQEGVNAGGRLGYMIPRFDRDAYDTITLALDKGLIAAGKESLSDIWRGIKFRSSEDYQKFGLNYDVSQVVRETAVNEELTRIPILGVAKMPKDRVSMNLLKSMVVYTASAVTHRMLVETSPTAQILVKTLQNAGPLEAKNKYNKNILNSLGKAVNVKMPQTESRFNSSREKAITALYDTHYLGQRYANTLVDQAAPELMSSAKKVSSFMMKMASNSFFAFNLTSALKNRFAAIIQNYTEAAAGEFLSFRALRTGKAIAARATVELTSNIYHRGNKPKNVQIAQLFNLDESLNKAAEGLYRTLGRDAASGSWTMSARKLLEMNGALELLYGMMHFQKVKLTSGQEIPLYEAFRIEDGELTMRPDVVDEWQMNGEEFLNFKIKYQGVFDRLQGNYKGLRQPQAQRYLLYKHVLFMHKFFISMFQRRFAGAFTTDPIGARMQADIGEYQGGYYVTSARYILKHARDFMGGGMSLRDIKTDPHERAALKRLGMDLGAQFILVTTIRMMLSLLFDYDEEDEKRKSKSTLRRATGAIPFFGVEDDRDFNLVNFMTIHAINQMMQVQLESSTFNPIPGNYSSLFLETQGKLNKPFTAWDPSFGRTYRVFDLMWKSMTGDSRGYYTRDVGPMWYQKKGAAKWQNEFFQIFGGGGLKDLDAVKRLESTMQAKYMKSRS